jgi:hypothetical protein
MSDDLAVPRRTDDSRSNNATDLKEKIMTRTVADQMVETLAAAGVERIYGIVGDGLFTAS